MIRYYPFLYWQNRLERLWKKPPKSGPVDLSYFGEFGYELQIIIPYAYYLYTQKRLRSTRSTIGTRELYYFSPNHTEEQRKRTIELPKFTPNFTPHVRNLNEEEWTPPPYKKIYKNDRFIYKKPLYIIHNKYNREWGRKPTNMFTTETLDQLFAILKGRYQIIYIRPGFAAEHAEERGYSPDAAEPQELPMEQELLQGKYPDVLTMQDLLRKNTDLTYNTLQCMLHANCNRFMSVQGGCAVLASYFGGQNIILAKKGRELRCGAYDGHYSKYSGCRILQRQCEEEILQLVAEQEQNSFHN